MESITLVNQVSYLVEIVDYLPIDLVSKKEGEKLQILLEKLPPLSGSIVECHLEENQTKTDFSQRISISDGGRELLTGLTPLFSLPSKFLSEPVWNNIYQFCAAWLRTESEEYRFVENLWLEFDSATYLDEAPIPCVFLDFHGSHREYQRQVLPELMLKLTGKQLDTFLFYCLKNLPHGAEVHYVGTMLSRKNQITRLNLIMSSKNVIPYLERIEQREILAAFYSESWVLEYSDEIVLGFDLHGEILGKIGLEIKPKSEKMLQEFLDRIVNRGICTQAKRFAVENWPGESPVLANGRFSKKISIDPVLSIKSGIERVFVRRINHFKMTLQPNKKPEVKVYLYVGYGWVKANEKFME